MNSAAGRDVLSPARTFEVRQVILEHISPMEPGRAARVHLFRHRRTDKRRLSRLRTCRMDIE